MHWEEPVIAACAALTVIAAGLGFLWKRLRGLSRFLDQWHGADGEPGMYVRVGNLESDMAEVKDQLRPNGGTSLYDKVTRIDDALPASAPEIHIHTDGKGSA